MTGSMFRIDANTIHYLVKVAAKRAGLGDAIAPHDLRRTQARLAREGGASLEQIQQVLGHASVETTQRYLGTRLELREGLAATDYMQMQTQIQTGEKV